jgi:glycerol kinase
MRNILAIDQGTTSSRGIVFDGEMRVVAVDQLEFEQHFPKSGWVEHVAEDLIQTAIQTANGAIEKSGFAQGDFAGIGITNQRETTGIWDKRTGEAIHNAIVWQDRRTAAYCDELKAASFEPEVTEKTGLLLDPYFSSTKVKWLLDNVPNARADADAGHLLFGTVDSFLIWRLTSGKRHVTDATNAARTMLYNIRESRWDEDICRMLDIPMNLLPEVLDCAADFGVTDPSICGFELPILGVAGDHQASTLGQACFEAGLLKSSYGTGCFALLNTGDTLVTSKNKLLGTIAYQLDGKVTYALEGSIFIAGAVVQWLRDGLGVIENAADTHKLAEQADPEQELYLVPAFTGLGAPHWDANARGAIYGLTRGSGPAEFARAALESVGFQTRELLDAMRDDWSQSGEAVLRVDGGMSASDWAMQFLSDILDAPVDRPKVLETTALGVAWLAGMRAGIYPDQSGFTANWALDRQFTPEMDEKTRVRRFSGWQDAIDRTLTR